MMEEDRDFEDFKRFTKWVHANKESCDQTVSYQDYLKFKAVSQFPEGGKSMYVYMCIACG